MGVFAVELKTAMSELNWNQAYVVGKAGKISSPMLSRYLAGNELPRLAALDAVCSIFPDEQRGRIVMAYLQELIPPSGRRLVEVVPTHDFQDDPVEGKSKIREVRNLPVYGKVSPKSELHAVLVRLGQRAMANKDVLKMLESLDRSLAGLPVIES